MRRNENPTGGNPPRHQRNPHPVKLNIDGTGKSSIKTGIPFFDHMLTLFARHAVVDLKLRCEGDLEVDAHHTVEDCGIALGQAFVAGAGRQERHSPLWQRALIRAILSPARRMCRWTNAWRGASLTSAAGPIWSGAGLNDFAYKSVSKAEKDQDMSSAFRFGLAREFFQGFANEARCNLHLELLYGDEPHHIVGSLVQGVCQGRGCRLPADPRMAGQLPTTKGKL